MTLTKPQLTQIEAALAQFWEDNAIADQTGSADDTLDYLAPLDSMSAVEVLIELDQIVGQELRAGAIIRKGGYDSKEQFVSDVTKQVLAYL
jgi:hypothetical protein